MSRIIYNNEQKIIQKNMVQIKTYQMAHLIFALAFQMNNKKNNQILKFLQFIRVLFQQDKLKINKINSQIMNKHQQQSTSPNSQQINLKTFTPTIGMINNIKTIDCHISLSPQNQTHKFTVNYKLLNIFELLVKRRLILAFENIASMTYQLRIKQSNVFIPQALLNGDTNVIHQYKKLLEKGKIQSYIKLNIRKQEVSRQKKPRPVSLIEKDSKASLQQLYNKKMIIANNNYMTNLMEKNSLLIDNLDSNQTTVKKISNSRNQKLWQQKQTQNPLIKSTVFKPYIQQNNNENYLSVTGEFRQQIHHHHSFYHHKKTKKSSQSVTNKSQKKNPFQGIKINYFQVKSSTKENPQMATFIYPTMGVNNKSGPKSVRENNNNNNKSRVQHSTIKTEIVDIENLQKKSSYKNYQSPSKNNLYTVSNKNYEEYDKLSPIHNYMETDKYSIRSHMINKPELNEKKIKVNNSLYIGEDFKNEAKNLNKYLLGEQFNTGNPLMIGHQRNIVKRKVKVYTNSNNNKDFISAGLEMNML